MNNTFSFGIIIPAAGSSSRLGQPKQLLPVKGKNLLDHAIIVAGKTSAAHIVAVVNDQIKSEISPESRIDIIINENSKQGISSSIKKGMDKLLQIKPFINAVIIMVCDQPFVSNIVLNDLVKQHVTTGKPIVACSYGGTFGTPALFHNSYFSRLMGLTGDLGAKKIITQNEPDLATIEFSQGSFDIDTAGDWEKWKNFAKA